MFIFNYYQNIRGHRGRDRMAVGFTTTYAVSAYHPPLMLWVRISIRARYTTLCKKVCQWLATDRWFSLCSPVSSSNKTDRHDITEYWLLFKVALNTIKQTNKHQNMFRKAFLFCFSQLYTTRYYREDTLRPG